MILFKYLVAHRVVFIGCAYALSAVNYVLAIAGQRAAERQQFLARGDAAERRSAMPFLFTTIVSAAALIAADPLFTEFFLGGFFIAQLFAFAYAVSNLLTFRALCRPGAADGRIQYSPAFRYRSQGAHATGGAALSLAGLGLTASPAFAGAALLCVATAATVYRRARRAA